MLGDQVAGHSRVLAILNTDVMVRPPTICVSKVTVDNDKPFYNVYIGTQDNNSMGGPSRTLSSYGIIIPASFSPI